MTSLPKAPRAFISPLLLAGAAFLTHTALKASFKNPNLDIDSSFQVNSLFGPNGSSSQSIEAPESTSLEVFGDYLTFMLLCAIFNLMMMLYVRVTEGFTSHQIHHFKGQYGQLTSQDTSYQQDLDNQESFLIKLIRLIQPLIKGALCYTLAFCFFKLAFFCAFTFYTSQKISSPEFRTLEESQDTLAVLSIPHTPEKVSLAMGRVLASFDVEPAIIAISQDEKWAYVSAKNPQLIRIYDTSDFKAPKQVATVNLGKLHRSRVFLELSADGTLLIATNYVDVKIIDVKNPRSPQIIGSFESLMEKSSDTTTFVSLALSIDNKYLFMAQVGFVILDISKPSNISMLYTSVERASTGAGNLVSLSASRDRKLLYLANGKGALEVYNMTNPSQPLLVNQVNHLEGGRKIAVSS